MILSPDPGSPTRPSRGTLLEIDPNIRNGAAIPPDVDPLSNAISKTPDLRPIASTSGDRDENSNSNTTSNQVAISPIADSSPWEADARRIQTLSTSTLYIPPADPSRQGAELADGSTAPPIATPVMSVQQVSTQQGGASVLPLQSPNDNALFVTFLFLNGNRHRMILDAQCFEQNNILPRDPSDPLTTSIIALKELLWRIWKAGMCFDFASFPVGLSCCSLHLTIHAWLL